MNYITVLIPVYNVESRLKNCVSSLFNNTFSNHCNFIFIDDGSTDNSILILNQIISEYPSLKENIKVIKHSTNLGIAKTREELINYVNTEYFIFVDSDDFVANNFFEKLYNKAKEIDADFVECNYKVVELNQRIIEIPQFKYSTNKEALIGRLQSKVPPYLVIRLIKTAFWKENNIHFLDNVTISEDEWIIFNLLCFAKKFTQIGDELYFYIRSFNSLTTKLYNFKHASSLVESFKNSANLISEKYPDQDFSKLINIRKANIKRQILLNSNFYTQRKFRTLWKEELICSGIFFNFLLKNKCKLLWEMCIIFIMFLKCLKIKKFSLKKYFTER